MYIADGRQGKRITTLMLAPQGVLRRTSNQAVENNPASDTVLQCGNAEGLHDSFGGLCLNSDLLTERHPDTCLTSWLHASFDPAQTWKDEFAAALQLLSNDRRETTKHLRHHSFLQLCLASQSVCQRTLGHNLLGSFHCLHCLNGSHSQKKGSTEYTSALA